MAPPKCDSCLVYRKADAPYSKICCPICNLKCCTVHAYPCMCGCKRRTCSKCYNRHDCKKHGSYYIMFGCPTDCPWCLEDHYGRKNQRISKKNSL